MTVKMTVSIAGVQVGEVDQIAYHPAMNVQLAMEEAYNLHSDKAFNFSIHTSAAIWDTRRLIHGRLVDSRRRGE
jgi:hypothetical protein